MVIDTSAVVAILLREPESRALAQSIEDDPVRMMSAVNWLEAHMVMSGRSGRQGGALVDTFVLESRVEIVPFDAHQAQAALSAWNRFGKGRHPAGLNLAGCCAYAAARLEDQPLLFKGSEFSRSDVTAVDW